LNQFIDNDSLSFALTFSDGRAVQWTFAASSDQELSHELIRIENIRGLNSEWSVDDRQPFTSGFRFVAADRLGPTAANDTSYYSVRELRQIGKRGEHAVHYIAEYQNYPIAIPALRHASLPLERTDLLSNTRAWLQNISPGISFNVTGFPGINKAAVDYEYDVGRSSTFSNRIRPMNIGFGVTYVLPIIVSALASAPGDMLVVENPEAHVHPSGQVHLAMLLALAANSGVQVLIESHSDHILNGMRLAVKRGMIPFEDVSMFSFNRAVGDPSHSVSIVMPKMDRHGKIDGWPQGFFDEAERALLELL